MFKSKPGLIQDPNNPQATATSQALKKRRDRANAKLKLQADLITGKPPEPKGKL